MKIKILYMYSEAMDLYGDKKNLEQLCKRICETGAEVEVDTCEIWDELNLSNYHMVYMGHGKAKNLEAVSKHFLKYADSIIDHIKDGQVWFVTGNARELFGRGFFTTNGELINGIGLFDYSATETNKVYVADMIGKLSFSSSIACYGFTNRTAHLVHPHGNNTPLFRNVKGFGDGEEEDGCEGTLYNNFFATWSMGPVLVRNPALMQEILGRLGLNYSRCDFSLEQDALQLVLKEFETKE